MTLELEENNATEALEHSYLEVNGSESIPVENLQKSILLEKSNALFVLKFPWNPLSLHVVTFTAKHV